MKSCSSASAKSFLSLTCIFIGPQASNWSGPGDLAKGSIYKCEALYALV